MSGPICRILIVDDEPLARKRIRDLLNKRGECRIVAEAANGQEAAQAIADHRPEIVFLDIEMPVVNGFDLIKLIGPEKMPVVIFVTAYDRYAIRAFDVAAVDYILKPFERERFYQALERALVAVAGKGAKQNQVRLQEALDQTKKRQSSIQRILVKSTGSVSIVDIDQVEWVEAQGNYVLLHTRKENYLHRETIKSLSASLDPSRFVRIHRSTVVNLAFVKRVESEPGGDRTVVLKCGTELRLSRRFRVEFDKKFS